VSVHLHDHIDFVLRLRDRHACAEPRIYLQEPVKRRRELQPGRMTAHLHQLRLRLRLGPDDVAIAGHVLDRPDAACGQRIEPLLLDRADKLHDLQSRVRGRLRRKRRRCAQRIALRVEAMRRELEHVGFGVDPYLRRRVGDCSRIDLVQREAAVVLKQLHTGLVRRERAFGRNGLGVAIRRTCRRRGDMSGWRRSAAGADQRREDCCGSD
jgi:hypothetical protein